MIENIIERARVDEQIRGYVFDEAERTNLTGISSLVQIVELLNYDLSLESVLDQETPRPDKKGQIKRPLNSYMLFATYTEKLKHFQVQFTKL